MKIIFYYYSGTGNTNYLAKKMQACFALQNVFVQLCNVTNIDNKDYLNYNVDEFDIVGFGYPIHAFSTPLNFDIFVRNLSIKDKEYFILKNSREALSINDSSSKRIVKDLKKKGCKLIQEKHLLMPYNIHFRHDDRLVKQMLVALEEKLPIFVNEIVNKEYKELHFRIIPTLCTKIVGGIECKGAKIIGNSFYATDNCISCGKCARECPNNNIKMKEEKSKLVPYFNNSKCMLCMRCIMNCPARCIVIGKIIRGWEVYGQYDFEEIMANELIKGDYITDDYKGSLANSYKKYFLGE